MNVILTLKENSLTEIWTEDYLNELTNVVYTVTKTCTTYLDLNERINMGLCGVLRWHKRHKDNVIINL